VTGPRADWPALAAPTDRQVGQVRDTAAGRSLVGMHAELRHEYGAQWGLAVIGLRDGRRVPFFGDSVEAAPGQETQAATARLALAGYQVRGWSEVPGGWDAELS
jgi:hypothetical protein